MAGKKKRGTSVKKREAMSKFGARVEPNDQEPPFGHAIGMGGPAKLPIEGKHGGKTAKGAKAAKKVTAIKAIKRRKKA